MTQTLVEVAPTGDPFWTSTALSAIRALAATGRPFTVYEAACDPYGVTEPPHENYWGSLASLAKHLGIIKAVGWVPSPRPSRNGGICRLWIGATA